MQISASIVLYDNKKEIVLEAIKSFLSTSLDVKLYLIDNSKNDTLKSLGEVDKRITYIYNNENLGFGKAHNIALQKSLMDFTSYHLVLNPDVSFNKGVLESLLSYLQQNSDVALVMPKVYYPNGSLQYTCRRLPTPFDLIIRRFIPKSIHLFDNAKKEYELHDFGYDKEMNIPFFLGSFMFLRTDALREVGVFDENIFLYMEDLDLCRRLHQKYKTMFYPYVSITHIHARDSYKNYGLLKEHIKSTIYYFNKWGWFFDKERKEINNALSKRIKGL